MSITQERKQELIKEFAIKEGDTGSPEVQVAILSEAPPFAGLCQKQRSVPLRKLDYPSGSAPLSALIFRSPAFDESRGFGQSKY